MARVTPDGKYLFFQPPGGQRRLARPLLGRRRVIEEMRPKK